MAAGRNVYTKFRSWLHFTLYSVNGKGGKYFSVSNHLCTVSSRNTKPQIKSLDEIPGPKPIPILGSAYKVFLSSKPIGKRVLELQLKNFKDFGPIVRSTAPGGSAVLGIYNPSDAEKIYRCEPKFPKRIISPLFSYYRQTRKKKAGVFFLNDQEWHKHRSVISKRVLKPKEVVEYVPVFNEIISELVQRFRSVRGRDGKEYEVPNLDNELFKWSFESVGHVLFDRRFGVVGDGNNPEGQDFISAIGNFLDSSFQSMFVPVWFYKYIHETKNYKKFVENFDKMYSYAELFIDNKVRVLQAQGKLNSDEAEEGERVDFLKFLLSSKQLTKNDLLASVIDLLFAGVDTTSNTMQWVLYMMGKNPEKQELLYQEVTSVLPRGVHASAKSLAKMPYLKAWVRETLRLYPVLSAIPRTLSEDLVLSGYIVPAGTSVNLMYYVMSRNEKIFKDAADFKPERWLRNVETEGINEEFKRFASLPFGFGARMCIGRRIAEMELHLLLARVVQEFQVCYPHNIEIEPYNRGAMMPDQPVRVQFIDRM